METRTAIAEDARLIASHRRAMFAAMHAADESALDAIERVSVPWTECAIREGRYLGWIMSDDGKPVASAGMLILDLPPTPHDPENTQRAYLLNVFVEASHRRRGLARELVQLCLDEARRRKIRVVTLHASDAGRPLYESLGFAITGEMRLVVAEA